MEVLNATLQDIDTVVWGESPPYVSPKVPTWEMQLLDIVNCHILALKECKEGPIAISISKVEGMRTVPRPLKLRRGSIKTHPNLVPIGDADKTDNILLNLATSTIRRQLRSILSHADYYRKFIRKYALIAAPLKNLVTKDVLFFLDDECQKNMSLALNYLGNKLVLGEDVHKV